VALDEDRVRDEPYDTTVQPYREVRPGDPDYALGVEGATARLREYHDGKRYPYCPDRSDIVVPEALTTDDADKLVPPDTVQYQDSDQKVVVMPKDAVPDQAHVVPSDLTDPQGAWVPRRDDWHKVLVELMTDSPTQKAKEALKVAQLLQDLHITQKMRDYATQEIPFGLWKAKPGCDFKSVPRASSIAAVDRGMWMDNRAANVTDTSPVYKITPGGAVFTNICINCHGPQADSKGVLAEAISEMTGGAARVADFKDGLLGPVGHEGANFMRVFGGEEMTARYLAWMALGGTSRVLPTPLLRIAGATLVMGQSRTKLPPGGASDANMLNLAKSLCRVVLADSTKPSISFFDYFDPSPSPDSTKPKSRFSMFKWGEQGLLDTNGDAEMWMRLCTVGNRPVVRVPRYESGSGWVLKYGGSYFWGEGYGQNPVLNDRGLIDADGIHQDPDRGDYNLIPVCVPADDVKQAPPIAVLKGADGNPIPTCPPQLLEQTLGPDGVNQVYTHQLAWSNNPPTLTGRDDEWAVRGAANAGVAVFLYLEGVRMGQLQPKIPYDHCEQLNMSNADAGAGK
jgi:mono/diheme cytochrome c family protein